MSKRFFCLSVISGMVLVLLSQTVLAESWVDRTNVSGFYSARYSVTNEKAYFHGDRETGINDEGSFQGTKLGLTVSSQVTDDVNVVLLLMSSGDEGKFNSSLDWAFASFNLTDEFTLRAGKIKFPVGLVNEVVDVGVTYPWITAPLLLYSDEFSGPQATREAYTGASLLWNGDFDDWTLGTDLFFGQVDLDGDTDADSMAVKGIFGVTLKANWDDVIEVQASSYEGDMHTNTSSGATMMQLAMNDKTHGADLLGIKVDWNNIIGYAEIAKVKMDVTMMGVRVGDSDTWYATLGYRFGRLLPHITQQDWERGNGSNHQITTLGVNYGLSDSIVVKIERSRISTDDFATEPSLFDVSPAKADTDMTSVAVDIIF